jgi:Anti-sigma-K factor rskA
VNREPSLDDLIGTDTTGAERQRLQHVHDLLLEAGPPPELTPELEAGPTLAMSMGTRRRAAKPRALLLLAAALMVLLVFFGGYAVGNGGGGKNAGKPVIVQLLKATPRAPQAQGTLEVWSSNDGKNWPMTLNVAGLSQLPPHTYYEVYLVRDGKPWGSCGRFRVGGSDRATTVRLTAPYSLKKGDTWVVTRSGPGGAEPGQTVLRGVAA